MIVIVLSAKWRLRSLTETDVVLFGGQIIFGCIFHILQHMTKQEKAQALLNLAKKLAKDKTCPLSKTAKNPVPGEGSPHAQIFFIGEAPGRNEDETGRPFVGAAGKVLEKLLSTIGLSREDVFITSIEKFRPPNNREPKPVEIMACFPYLEKQIEIIAPRIIVPLGRHALKRILEWEKGETIDSPINMKIFVGRAFKGHSERIYLPVYHPAAALYNRSLYASLETDFKKIQKLLKKKTSQ
jgi:uracil-DNA glycosylase family 4